MTVLLTLQKLVDSEDVKVAKDVMSEVCKGVLCVGILYV